MEYVLVLVGLELEMDFGYLFISQSALNVDRLSYTGGGRRVRMQNIVRFMYAIVAVYYVESL